MNSDAKAELKLDAQDLAYNHIKLSGLFRSLSGAEWDAMAEKFANKLLAQLDLLVDEEMGAERRAA